MKLEPGITSLTTGIEYNRRYFYFKYTLSAGWLPVLPSGEYTKRDHPKGAWAELAKQYPQDFTAQSGEG